MDTLDVYGTFDVPTAFNQIIKNEGDIAQRQSDVFSLSQALQSKQAVDIDNSQSILSALQTKQITDNAAQDALAGTIATKSLTDLSAINLQQMTQFERDIQNRVHENRWLITKEVHDQADMGSQKAKMDADIIQQQLRALEVGQVATAADVKYAGLANTQAILNQLAANKYDWAKDKIDALRERHEDDRHRYGLALQSQELNSLKQMINSVEQTQQFGSKTVQFGAGNTAGTAQTANQG